MNSLIHKVTHYLHDSLGEEGAKWGLSLIDQKTGKSLAWQDNEWFIPASNQKLWTSAVALDQLGPDYRWTTQFGVSDQTLWVIGGGDPVYSWDDVCHMVRCLKERGVKKIDRICLDDSLFQSERWGTGWMWDDLVMGFAAPIHALNLEENRIPFQISFQDEGIQLENPFSFVESRLDASRLEVSPSDETEYTLVRTENRYDYVACGVIARDEEEMEAAVESGPEFFYLAIRSACQYAGIEIDEQVSFFVQPISQELLETSSIHLFHESPPLAEVLKLVNQDSRNLVAEVLLRTLPLQQDGVGSVEAGVKIVEDVCKHWNLKLPGRYVDGSGLSTYNFSSPLTLRKLLEHMLEHPNTFTFQESLAQLGKSGTLEHRDLELPSSWDLKAKTGTVNGVKTLSGYLYEHGEVRIIFSCMINGLIKEDHGAEMGNYLIRELIASLDDHNLSK
ncbi:D-alanyl-D-alanine carboxypeptidase/D-alanyl-D-alanine endopeptidase [Hazenella coriacea]|uniref:D-alanyl-D-alanine carboxypeptidase/D-alanyl-D-alanine-endopeptidase (Penicillin-binding protein 4) n=1 Tax=Hazenella coriacea TaxID=1179467 RepID=A0A4R3L4L2_9BACL|nr:D-alanyl-D-alanine carboxypeptidase/D-alanyl-D-alanine-endopeptidase [Hazenella coriacea]TCS94721.1 D-alanyl-D-alanine carboxypeptidase/D-alanyl-D-alanine-endopeptidase (penicillin-binding protein 4) [Hazenella coriacea]